MTFNSEEYVQDCLNSVLRTDYPDFEIIVVDNGSRDSSAEIVSRFSPRLRILRNETNLGFATANNIGIRHCAGEVIVLLNPDTTVDQRWLRELMAAMSADKRIAVAGCKILFMNTRIIQHAGGIIRPNGLTDHYGSGEIDRGQYDKVRYVAYVTGAAIAFRRDLVYRTGLFHEGYRPAYYEETELCWRARVLGHKVAYVPGAVVYHRQAASSGGARSITYLTAFHNSRIRFVLRNFSLKQLLFNFLPFEVGWYRRYCPKFERLIVLRAYAANLMAVPPVRFQRNPTPAA